MREQRQVTPGEAVFSQDLWAGHQNQLVRSRACRSRSPLCPDQSALSWRKAFCPDAALPRRQGDLGHFVPCMMAPSRFGAAVSFGGACRAIQKASCSTGHRHFSFSVGYCTSQYSQDICRDACISAVAACGDGTVARDFGLPTPRFLPCKRGPSRKTIPSPEGTLFVTPRKMSRLFRCRKAFDNRALQFLPVWQAELGLQRTMSC